MNKTTLESLEEALERLEQIDGMYSWAHLLYEVREALAEQEKQEPVVYYAYATIKEYEELAGFSVSQAFRAGWNMARTTNSMLGINAAPVQPVKQKPVAWAYFDADGTFMDALDRQHGAYQTPLHAEPVSAEAIRAEALEEAAKVCRTAQAQGIQSIREAIEEAIRGLK